MFFFLLGLTVSGHSTALPCTEWESRPITEKPKVRFHFYDLHRNCFGKHTADSAHPVRVLEPSTC